MFKLLHNEQSSEDSHGRVQVKLQKCAVPSGPCSQGSCSHNFKMCEVTKCFEQAFTVIFKANTLLLNNLFPKETPQSTFMSVPAP